MGSDVEPFPSPSCACVVDVLPTRWVRAAGCVAHVSGMQRDADGLRREMQAPRQSGQIRVTCGASPISDFFSGTACQIAAQVREAPRARDKSSRDKALAALNMGWNETDWPMADDYLAFRPSLAPKTGAAPASFAEWEVSCLSSVSRVSRALPPARRRPAAPEHRPSSSHAVAPCVRPSHDAAISSGVLAETFGAQRHHVL